MIHWALFSTLTAGILYCCHRLLFARDHWLQLSRVYLIVALVFSLLMPLVTIPYIPLPVAGGRGGIVATGTPTVTADAATVTAGQSVTFGMEYLPTIVYLLGLMAALAVLVTDTVRIVVHLGRLPVRRHGRLRLHLLDDDSEPCSFMNHIIIGMRGRSNDELRCLMVHEGTHVRLGHTVDVLAMRLACCAAWFNPFAWLMLRDLRAVHEYQADEAAVCRCGRKDYMGLLYRQATGLGYGHITNNFQSINIKKRITMMKKQKTRFGAWKMLAVLPVAAALMMMGCKPAEATDAETTATPEAIVGTAVNDTVYNVVDVMPEFPGGMEALYKYLVDNIRYPEQAKKDGVQGMVYVRFVVEADGSISNAKVMRGIGGGCDEEALRVVNAMPKWQPGKMQDKPVRTQFYLPFTFKL